MKVISSIFLFFATTGGDPTSLQKHLGSGQEAREPISPSLVAQSVSDYLWEKKFVSHTPSDFLIKGSYPASVYAVEQGYAPTHYNDIDVFVQVPYAHSDCKELSEIDKKQAFLESDYVQGVIPGVAETIQVNVNIMCELDPSFSVLRDSDINGVKVGFTVIASQDRHSKAEIGEWITSDSFETYLNDKDHTLRVEEHVNFGAHSVVRLLRKSEQLGVSYEFPDENFLMKFVHGELLLGKYKHVLDSLSSESQSEIYSRFDVLPLEDDEEIYVFVRKGLDSPTPPLTRELWSHRSYYRRGSHQRNRGNYIKNHNSGGWSCGIREGHGGAQTYSAFATVQCYGGGRCVNHQNCRINVNGYGRASWSASHKCLNGINGEFYVPSGCSVTCIGGCSEKGSSGRRDRRSLNVANDNSGGSLPVPINAWIMVATSSILALAAAAVSYWF